jgi:CubicO group peptidase (beta-lactamase class C family)
MRRKALNALLARESLQAPPGDVTQYSDPGFMFLRWVVETVSGLRLDRFAENCIFRPLGLADDLYFIDLSRPPPPGPYAATEACPWRGFLLEGQVHDENAWAVGGVDGQAGLFGTPSAVSTLLAELMAVHDGNRCAGIFEPAVLRSFFQPAGPGGRALGFDTPSPGGSSCGRRFSDRTVGHLGFTGTSFWIDLDRHVGIVLLTNRVHPSRANERIRAFRPRIHDAVMAALSF